MIITYEKTKLQYVDNNSNKTCCVCLENPDTVYCCDKCKDGVVCKDCHQKTAKLSNLANLILFTYRCPICRDFVGEDLDEDLVEKYGFDNKFILGKILKFNRDNIRDFHMRNREDYEDYSSDEDDYNDYDDGFYSREEMINDDLMETLSSIHGLTGDVRLRQAERQTREIDVINNVYYLSDLFEED